jgi:hypothetical protein
MSTFQSESFMVLANQNLLNFSVNPQANYGNMGLFSRIDIRQNTKLILLLAKLLKPIAVSLLRQPRHQ